MITEHLQVGNYYNEIIVMRNEIEMIGVLIPVLKSSMICAWVTQPVKPGLLISAPGHDRRVMK